ncbi:gamma-glutamylcyclotransferase family protein [Flexibacterium corallicola]|uniref:gamma-glutamylcyclotransferase family protein n=1 Tax=Flexibacterium corallicola TaxID=3037259 RepID=UPI00286EE588|nr:gamma-glutamylcyclotransferase family protein [Pseudovibrio sp. M1P-2-3]
MTHFIYFAYGSNMLSSRLRRRCPSARIIGKAVAKNYKLEFSKKSKDGSGKATLIETSDSFDARGVLFKIAADELPLLDRLEGAGKGYRRIDKFKVITESGPQSVTTYLATEMTGSLYPYDWYLALVIAGAMEHDLGAEYIDQLQAVTYQEDPIADRKSRDIALKVLQGHGYEKISDLLSHL